MASEPAKVNPRTQCYRCQGYGHFASQYLSQIKTLLVKISIREVEEGHGLEVAMFQQDDDSNASAEKYEFNGCIRTLTVTDLTLSYDRTQLGVVMCILAQLEQVNDWRRTAIFQICTKIENKSCKVKVDSDSCTTSLRQN